MKIDIADHDGTIQWGGVYYFALSDYPNISAWELQKLARFAQYEQAHSRRPRLKCEHPGIRRAAKLALRRPETIPAADVPAKLTECTACKQGGCLTELLCHTADGAAAQSIFACGELRSAVRARGLPGAVLAKEPRNAAGDTADYFDYVMFAWGNCVAGDRLVTERRLGRAPTEAEFLGAILPGVRFYFRYAALAAHPNRVYDGYHPVKIRDCVDLRDYLVACVIPSYLWVELSPLIPPALQGRAHCLPYDGENLWDWGEKCYNFVQDALKPTQPEPITARTRPLVTAFIAREWHGTGMLLRGELIDMTKVDGFVWLEPDGATIRGLITYLIRDGVCEITSLNSQRENQGVGTSLLELVKLHAREQGCHKLQLLTTNDNINALRFYQKRGFDLAGVNLGAIDRGRALKPEIPLTGQNGIPLRHEIEFAMEL